MHWVLNFNKWKPLKSVAVSLFSRWAQYKIWQLQPAVWYISNPLPTCLSLVWGVWSKSSAAKEVKKVRIQTKCLFALAPVQVNHLQQLQIYHWAWWGQSPGRWSPGASKRQWRGGFVLPWGVQLWPSCLCIGMLRLMMGNTFSVKQFHCYVNDSLGGPWGLFQVTLGLWSLCWTLWTSVWPAEASRSYFWFLEGKLFLKTESSFQMLLWVILRSMEANRMGCRPGTTWKSPQGPPNEAFCHTNTSKHYIRVRLFFYGTAFAYVVLRQSVCH